MHRFWTAVTRPVVEIVRPRSILEIGCADGAHTRLLLEYCRANDAVLHAVDPKPRFDVGAWSRLFREALVFHRAKSLDALRDIGAVDLALVDGDHNWYSVLSELQLIGEAADAAGKELPVVLLHDVGWPYGRRDLYYNPAQIPEESRQPYGRIGIRRPGAGANEGTLNAHLCNALFEGGERNGVLTAVEDFVRTRDESLEFRCIPVLYGLGILAPRTRWETMTEIAAQLDELKRPVLRALLEALEADRLAGEVRRQRLMAIAHEGARSPRSD